MRRPLTAVCLTALLTACLAAVAGASAGDDKKKDAQPRPDLSGTWSLDLKRSGWSVEGDAGRPRRPVRLVIRHRGPEVRMTRAAPAGGEERAHEVTYYADGRGEKNPVFSFRDRLLLDGTVESESRWKGGRLVIRGTQRLRALGDPAEVEFTESWELSADGRTLTQRTRHEPAQPSVRQGAYMHAVPSDIKYVYTREQ